MSVYMYISIFHVLLDKNDNDVDITIGIPELDEISKVSITYKILLSHNPVTHKSL